LAVAQPDGTATWEHASTSTTACWSSSLSACWRSRSLLLSTTTTTTTCNFSIPLPSLPRTLCQYVHDIFFLFVPPILSMPIFIFEISNSLFNFLIYSHVLLISIYIRRICDLLVRFSFFLSFYYFI